MNVLYRGVSKQMDEENNGMVLVKGSNSEVVARYDGQIKYDSGFRYGPSIENTVRAQQMDTKPYSPRAISTTTSEKVAKYFATEGNTTDGFIYVINEDGLADHGIKVSRIADPRLPSEAEVTLVMYESDFLPPSLVIQKYEVRSDWVLK